MEIHVKIMKQCILEWQEFSGWVLAGCARGAVCKDKSNESEVPRNCGHMMTPFVPRVCELVNQWKEGKKI